MLDSLYLQGNKLYANKQRKLALDFFVNHLAEDVKCAWGMGVAKEQGKKQAKIRAKQWFNID